jgi:hypothetical protein
MHVPIDDLCLGHAHEQKAYAIMGVGLIGVVNKNSVCSIVGRTKRVEAL